MTSFNDLINTDLFENEPQISISNNNSFEPIKSKVSLEPLLPLLVIDDTIPKDKLAFEGIHYLDSKNIYHTTKSFGDYTLKMHQCTTLHYMIGLEKMKYDVKTISNTSNSTENNIVAHTQHYTNIGILSDQVGAGKSYCIMGLINELKSIKPIDLPFRRIDIGSSNITPKKINKLDTNILLVPHSLIGQWSKYLENSGLKYYVVQKAKDVYGLGDKNCKFNTNVVKEEKEEKEINTKSSKSSKSSKTTETSKRKKATKLVVPEQKAENASNTANTANTSNKKKIILKTKSKISVAPIIEDNEIVNEIVNEVEVNEIISENIEDDSVTIKSSQKHKSETKKNLELEKLRIYREIRETEILINELRNHPNHRFQPHNYIRNPNENPPNPIPDRNSICEQISELNKVLSEKYKKHSEISSSIKNYDILNGIISSGQVQLLNTYNMIVNNSSNYAAADNYIDNTLKQYVENLSHINKPMVEGLDVILVSDTFYNLFSLFITRDDYTVNRLIIDECNSIKGVQLANINKIFTWLVTSSINSLMTSNGYIVKRQIVNNNSYNVREKTIMSTGFILNTICLLYDSKDNYKLFLVNNPEYIKQSILLPEMKTFIMICKDNVIIQVLNGIVSNDIMRMLNAGDIEGIINKLDVVVSDENNLIKMVTQKYSDELLVKEYELRVAIENAKYNPDIESISITNKRLAIKELQYKITCIEDRINNFDSCPICIDDLANPIITPCCNNKYCFNCITICLTNKPSCPSCRSNLLISNLMVINNKSKKDKIDEENKLEAENALKEKANTDNFMLQTYSGKTEYLKSVSLKFTKYENMDKIFELNNNHPVKKYLIFTEYESTLNTKITSILEKWNLTYDRIRGSSATINKQLEKYKKNGGNSSEETNVLLVNSKFFGSGMNLENTTDIIIMHKMQSDIEMQAIGRAHRFGRVGELRVWKLYYQNESL